MRGAAQNGVRTHTHTHTSLSALLPGCSSHLVSDGWVRCGGVPASFCGLTAASAASALSAPPTPPCLITPLFNLIHSNVFQSKWKVEVTLVATSVWLESGGWGCGWGRGTEIISFLQLLGAVMDLVDGVEHVKIQPGDSESGSRSQRSDFRGGGSGRASARSCEPACRTLPCCLGDQLQIATELVDLS